MASFGRARRAPGSGNAFLRPFAVLFVVSLALLLLRETAFVRAGATFVTELLVPAERVLGQVGSAGGGVWQAIAEIENLRTDNDSLKARVDQLTLENIQLREQAFQGQQAMQLAEAAKALKLKTQSAPVIARSGHRPRAVRRHPRDGLDPPDGGRESRRCGDHGRPRDRE